MAILRDVMTEDPVTVRPEATVAEAAGTMAQGRFGSLLVRGDAGIVGIFTERDVLRAAGTEGDLLTTRVRDWMTRDPMTAIADEDVDDAVTTMLTNGFRHLPVTEGGAIVGIVSLHDLLSARVAGGSPRVARRRPGTGTTARRTTPPTDRTPTTTPEPVQQRRERMLEVTRLLRQQARADQEDPERYRRGLADAVEELDEVLTAHVAQTEGDGGFFDELVRESGGRLQAAVRRLGRDHERSAVMVADLRAAIGEGAAPDDLRQAADELFAQLEAHRHRGSDMLWQAHGIEIGGGD